MLLDASYESPRSFGPVGPGMGNSPLIGGLPRFGRIERPSARRPGSTQRSKISRIIDKKQNRETKEGVGR